LILANPTVETIEERMQRSTTTNRQTNSRSEEQQQSGPHHEVPSTLGTAADFIKKELPSKEALIDGLLYRRDLVTLAGRRRHGKTALVMNLALILIDPFYKPHFLGYRTPAPRRVLMYLLEDDATELQDRLKTMMGEREYELDRLAIRTKDDFYPFGLKIDVSDQAFRDRVLKDIRDHKPDVVIIDNLAHLVGADYNNPTKMHEVTKFQYAMSNEGNCAIIIAAHPRKQTPDARFKPTLAKGRDDFFDEVMGSSHFVNSTGSLWAIEKTPEGYSYFFGGTQRLTGTSALSIVEMDGEGWFHVLSDAKAHFSLVVHTKKRKEAWAVLSEDRPFTYTEAEELCKPVLSSKSGFTSFWNDIKRLGLIVPKEGGFIAVAIPGAVKKAPDGAISKTNNNPLEKQPSTEPTPDHQTEDSSPTAEKPDQTETGLVASESDMTLN
jgi:hypothetical protein